MVPGVDPLIEPVDAMRDPDDGTLSAPVRNAEAKLVSEIWVADGEYILQDAAAHFELVEGAGKYGGFTGTGPGGLDERIRGVRDQIPQVNGTVLHGNGIANHAVLTGTVGRTTVFDGFVTTDGPNTAPGAREQVSSVRAGHVAKSAYYAKCSEWPGRHGRRDRGVTA